MSTPTKLSDLRVDDSPVPEYIPTIPGAGLVLAFDQAIRNTGWVLVGFSANRAGIMNAGVLQTKKPVRNLGWESTYASAMEMADQIDQVFADRLRIGIRPTLIVHETPPSAGKAARPDSSIMTGMAVRLAARKHCPDVPLLMIGKQKAANFLLGQPNADKSEVRDFLQAASWVDALDVLDQRSTYNEHQYDALSLAVSGQAEMGE